jgi:hypothetical protein
MLGAAVALVAAVGVLGGAAAPAGGLTVPGAGPINVNLYLYHSTISSGFAYVQEFDGGYPDGQYLDLVSTITVSGPLAAPLSVGNGVVKYIVQQVAKGVATTVLTETLDTSCNQAGQVTPATLNIDTNVCNGVIPLLLSPGTYRYTATYIPNSSLVSGAAQTNPTYFTVLDIS